MLNSGGNTIGGTTDAARNVVSSSTWDITLEGASSTNNVIVGNYVGTDKNGTAAIGAIHGIVIWNAPNNRVGGTSIAERNVISGNPNCGILLTSAGSTGNELQGNYIGTDATGGVALGNRLGVCLSNAHNTIVGGTASGAANVISGNTSNGFILSSGATGNVIQGNFIGTDATSSIALGNGSSDSTHGIWISDGSNNTIGGTGIGEPNIIVNNANVGVYVAVGAGNIISGNAIYSNGSIGIDLGPIDGVTNNDDAKTSGQPNLLMDFPVFTTATLLGTNLFVTGYVGSTADQATFANARVEIFESDNDASGHGEGQTFLGVLTADGSGNFSGTIDVSGKGLAAGENITGTATDGSNNTSEFGTHRIVVAPAVTVEDITEIEGTGLLFTVTLDYAVSGGFDVTVGFTDGTASGGAAPLATPEDFANDAVTLNFAGTADETQSFTVATLDDVLLEGNETFTVTLAASNANVDDSDTAVGTITENDTDLVVTKTVDNGTPDEGDTVTFTVTVTNSGSVQVTNVSIDDVLPAGLTAGTITPSQGSYTAPTWTIGTIDSGANATLTIQATVDAGTAGSTITNMVTNVSLDQVDSDTTADDLSESITVGNATDLVITKIVDNGTPDEGDTVTFTVTVTNNGPAQASNVSIDDALPAGLTAGTITPSQGSYTAPTWTVGTLADGASATLTITADVDAGTAGSTITNTVTNVTLDQTDSNTSADDPSESITVGNSTDLFIGKTVDNGSPDEGDTVTFTVTVTNSGPAQATNVSIDDALPAGLTAGTITPSQGSYTAPTWTVGTLADGASATLTITADVNAGTAGQTITNTVTNVTLDQVDSNTTADDLSESVTVGNTTDLVIGKTVDNGTPDEGDTITFTVTITNNGPAQASNVSIDDVLPAGLTIGSVTPSTGTWSAPTWTIGTLADGASATLTIQATVNAGTAGSTITNTATNVTLDQVDSNATADDPSESITVGNSTDLVIGKTVDNGTPDEGDTVTFTVTVTNNGPAQASNVSIDDALPAGLTAGTITPSQGSYTAPTWTVGTLADGASATLTITADVDAGTAGSTITNTVTNVTLDQVDDNTTADDLSESVTVGNSTDLVDWQRSLITEHPMKATPSPSPSRSQTTVRLRPPTSASMTCCRLA